MTAIPEARLAREAEIHYATLAFVTDYDVWHESEEEVSVELVLRNLLANVEMGRRMIRAALPAIPEAGAESAGGRPPVPAPPPWPAPSSPRVSASPARSGCAWPPGREVSLGGPAPRLSRCTAAPSVLNRASTWLSPQRYNSANGVQVRAQTVGSAAVVCVGTVGLDTVETPFGRAEEVLGGSASYFAAAALSARGRAWSAWWRTSRAHREFLAGRGADLDGLQVLPGRCFRWSGRYHFDLNRRDTLETQLNVLSDFQPRLPETFRDADLVFLANVDPVLQLAAGASAPARVTMLDSMNFWIEGARDALTAALGRWTSC